MTISSKRLAAAAVGCVAAIGISAPSAFADFASPYTSKCTGDSVVGKGSTFQNAVQAAWSSSWATTGPYCASPFGTAGKTVTYTGGGSGAGRTAVGATDTPGSARDAATAFAGTDEPVTPTQLANANEGPNVDAAADADDAALRTIPVISGAIAIIVNYPDHCTTPADFLFTKSNAPANTGRLKLSRARVERVFGADTTFDSWGELVTGINDDNSVDGDPNVNSCADLPIKRVVRLDESGSTFQLKRWLDVQRPTRHWKQEDGVYTNLQWPNDTVSNPVLRPAATGGGAVADLVNATDGSFGYVDLATARAKGFDKDDTAADDTYWMPIQDQAASFKEPTFSSSGFLKADDHQAYYGSALKKGANCRTTTYSNIPDVGSNGPDAADTLGSWSQVTGVASGANGGYPLCIMSYDMAWDDSWDAFGGPLPPTTPRPGEAQQRTVKDYLFYALSNTGQNKGDTADYSKLPDDVLINIARPAQLALNYHKS